MRSKRWPMHLTVGLLLGLAAGTATSAAAPPAGSAGSGPIRLMRAEQKEPAPEMLPPPQLALPEPVPAAPVLAPPPAEAEPPLAGEEPPAAGKSSFWARCKYVLQKCVLGFPEEFEAPPLGETVARHYRSHVANGEAARMVLHQYDFAPGSELLNERGLDRLLQIQQVLGHNFCPVVIERTPGCPQLAEARRLVVLNELARGPFPVPPERVVVGPSPSIGLAGVEAEIIYRNQLLQLQSGSLLPASAATGITGQATSTTTTTTGTATPFPR
jgi:hypothetical protein